MDNQARDKVVDDLQNGDEQIRWNALTTLCKAAENGVDFTLAVPLLAANLVEGNRNFRFGAGYALVAIVEHQGDIAFALPALAQALSDEDQEIGKEVVWALYCLERAGTDIHVAIPALTHYVHDTTRAGRNNGAIGLTLYYLNRGMEKEAQSLLQQNDNALQLGAAWGYMDYYLKGRQKAEFQAFVLSIPLALSGASMRNGVVGSLRWAQHNRGEDIAWVLQAIDELIAKVTDPMQQASIVGITTGLSWFEY